MNQKTDLPHLNGNGDSAQGSRVSRKLQLVHKLAKQDCANWCRDGTCQAIDFDSKSGRPFFWRKSGGQCLLSLDQRCPYLEAAVLPMERRKETDWKPFARGVAFREAAKLYHSVFPETVPPTVEVQKCPDCGKRSVEPRKRYCSACRNRRRKATNAENNRNWRKSTGQRDTVKENGSALGAASRAADSDTRYVDPPEPISGAKVYHGEGAPA